MQNDYTNCKIEDLSDEELFFNYVIADDYELLVIEDLLRDTFSVRESD